MASIAASGWLRIAWIFPRISQACAAFGLSARMLESRRRHHRIASQETQRKGSLPNRFGVIALGFEHLSGQAAGFADVVSGQRPPPLNPLQPPTPADQSRGRRVGRVYRQRLPDEDNRLGSGLFGKAMELRQRAQIEVV